jgi:tetratricopeptide (TPR) repeat protein
MADARIGRRRLGAVLALVVTATLVVGCASVNRLREAQESFNQAATLENELRFDAALQEGSMQGQLTQNTTIQNGYASALLSLDKIEAKDVERLKQDRLWGNVLALKALAQWKLGLLDRARDTAREVQQVGADQVLPRDRALLLALPGLIKTDEAFAALQRVPAEPTPEQRASTLKNVQLLVADAADAIDRGRGAVDAAHPVHVYLIQAKLAAFRNLQSARERLGDGDARTLPREQRLEVQRQLKELKCQAERLSLKPEIVNYWANRFTLAPEPGAC